MLSSRPTHGHAAVVWQRVSLVHSTPGQIALLCVVLTLSSLAASIVRSTRIYQFEQIACLAYYKQDHTQNAIDETLCKTEAVQTPLSIVVGVDAFLSLIPGAKIYYMVFRSLPWRIQSTQEICTCEQCTYRTS